MLECINLRHNDFTFLTDVIYYIINVYIPNPYCIHVIDYRNEQYMYTYHVYKLNVGNLNIYLFNPVTSHSNPLFICVLLLYIHKHS